MRRTDALHARHRPPARDQICSTRTMKQVFYTISGHPVALPEQQRHRTTSWWRIRVAWPLCARATPSCVAARQRVTLKRQNHVAPLPVHPCHTQRAIALFCIRTARPPSPPRRTAPHPASTVPEPPPKRPARASQPRARGGKAPVAALRGLCPATPSDDGAGRRGWRGAALAAARVRSKFSGISFAIIKHQRKRQVSNRV